MIKTAHIGMAVLLMMAMACKKDTIHEGEANDPIPSEPVITGVEFAPSQVSQFGAVTFFVHFTDGDGDLGDEDADVKSLRLVDQREDIVLEYHIPPQSPVGDITISGTLEVTVNNLILLDQQSTEEKAFYQISIRDRSGNWSEGFTAGPVLIKK